MESYYTRAFIFTLPSGIYTISNLNLINGKPIRIRIEKHLKSSSYIIDYIRAEGGWTRFSLSTAGETSVGSWTLGPMENYIPKETIETLIEKYINEITNQVILE